MTEFSTIKGEIVDAVMFSNSMIKNFPGVQIHVGTDSQNYSFYTKYATVIAYRNGNRGVSFIFPSQLFQRCVICGQDYRGRQKCPFNLQNYLLSTSI